MRVLIVIALLPLFSFQASDYVSEPEANAVQDLSYDICDELISTNQVAESLKVMFSDESDISAADIKKVTYQVNSGWNRLSTFQFLIRRKLMNLYETGLYLGVYPVEYKEKYSTPKLKTIHRLPASRNSLAICAEIKSKNDAIISDLRSIISEAALLDKSGMLDSLMKARKAEWTTLCQIQIMEEKTIADLTSHSGSLDEIELSSWELPRVRRDAMEQAIDNSAICFDSQSLADKKLKIFLGEFLVERIDHFKPRIIRLQTLLEARARLLAELELFNLDNQSEQTARDGFIATN